MYIYMHVYICFHVFVWLFVYVYLFAFYLITDRAHRPTHIPSQIRGTRRRDCGSSLVPGTHLGCSLAHEAVNLHPTSDQ